MIFTRAKNREFASFEPKLNGVPIDRKHVVRFLAVLVDDRLLWNHHVAALKAKMSRYVGIMSNYVLFSRQKHVHKSSIVLHNHI